jgi:hypothetical protein
VNNGANAVPYVASLPAFVMVFGGSGLGKTTDMIYAMPRALLIGTPAAFKSSVGRVGIALDKSQFREVNRISEITKLIERLPPEFDGVVVDDYSLTAEKTFAALEAKYSGFKLWGALRDENLEFRDAARSCKKHVLLNCHEVGPQTKNGVFMRGGPKLPGKLPEDMPVQCDLVLRAFHEPTRLGAWPVVYRCGPTDPMFTTKDRHDVTPDMAPMNLGEIMRTAGYALRRWPGLEWLDQVAEMLAQTLVQAQPHHYATVKQQAVDYMMSKHTQDDRHILWGLRDGFDRATFRQVRARRLETFRVA